jgi:hypothetical protein
MRERERAREKQGVPQVKTHRPTRISDRLSCRLREERISNPEVRTTMLSEGFRVFTQHF